MLDWNSVEKQISAEINFLHNLVHLSPYTQNDPIKCSDCLYRQIALMIISGKVRITKIEFKNKNILGINNFNFNAIRSLEKKHGADWHDSSIQKLHQYFQNNNVQTTSEPNLHYGRADLGVPELKIFIEVGTVNLYKLYYNLSYLSGCKILLIPVDFYAIEFNIL